ncbi:MAG: hypothetical protein H6917_08465 [Novosphingobium sp.]|nr:hypothetical protein [Novosphingobium sp.]MCP5402407.1 hypothetical protein [Novosphingobium sp.]
MTPLSGWLAQRYGRKRIILLSIAGFTLASLACCLSVTLEQPVVCRIIRSSAEQDLPYSPRPRFSISILRNGTDRPCRSSSS